MNVTLMHYLVFSALLFVTGFMGVVINQKNLIRTLVALEVMLLAVNTNFVAFSQFLHLAQGEVFVFFILTVAAAESAVGLAIIVLLYRVRGAIDLDELNRLKG